MNEKELATLIEKYKNATCTEAERILLESLHLRTYPVSGNPENDDARGQVWAALQRQHRHRRLRWLPYAAAVILIAGIGLYLSFFEQQAQGDAYIAATEVLPGSNKATLTLADGRVLELSSDQEGVVVGENEIVYIDGTVVLDEFEIGQDQVHADAHDQRAAEKYVLSTPAGGTYRITLPDGSIVWLNAASKLKYPARFEGAERVVELEGEAYFEIKEQRNKDQGQNGVIAQANALVAFKVKTRDQQVEVLGTQFNISAYTDEPAVTTTLVEGKVRLSLLPAPDRTSAEQAPVILSPGEQGTFANGFFKKEEVDVEHYVSWKDGVISLQGKPFPQLMRELSRWYNLEVEYEGRVPTNTYFGSAYRGDNLSVVMGVLESSGLRYRLQRHPDGSQKLTIINRKEVAP